MHINLLVLFIISFVVSNVLSVVATRSILEKSTIRWHSAGIGIVLFAVAGLPLLDSFFEGIENHWFTETKLAVDSGCGLILFGFIAIFFYQAMFFPLETLLKLDKDGKAIEKMRRAL